MEDITYPIYGQPIHNLIREQIQLRYDPPKVFQSARLFVSPLFRVHDCGSLSQGEERGLRCSKCLCLTGCADFTFHPARKLIGDFPRSPGQTIEMPPRFELAKVVVTRCRHRSCALQCESETENAVKNFDVTTLCDLKMI